MTNIRLYIDKNRFSPYAMSVYVALKEKGLIFQEYKIDLEQGEQYTAEYLKICPSHKVPCIVVDGMVLSESWAITEFLEDQFPFPAYPAIYPDQIIDRAKCRSIQSLVKTDFVAIREHMSSICVFLPPKQMLILTKQLTAEIEKLLVMSEAAIGDEWLSVDWSIADFDLAFMLHRLMSYGFEMSEKLVTYVQRNFQRKTVQAWLTQRILDEG